MIVSGVSNTTHTQTQTTFTFVGRFNDANITQVFRVDYTPNGGSATYYYFTFKKVKSLLQNNMPSQSCPAIQPGQNRVFPTRCQIVNIPISFSNVKWSNFTENNCFGSITTYEYQLPSGWSIGSNVSNGSNWIADDNSVTVTSNLSTGDGGVILIRPANNCASGLVNGQTPTVISISRPAPTLSISGPKAICVGGTGNYTVSGLPSGATVCWTISSSVATIPSSPYCNNTVTVTQTGSGLATLTATVSDCTGSYPPVNFVLALGTPVPEGIIAPDHDLCNTGGRDSEIAYFYIRNPISALTYYWQIDGMGAGIGTSLRVDAGRYDVGSHDIRVRSYSTECGYSNWYESYFIVADCSGYRFAISPNPAKDNVTIDGRQKNKNIKEVQVIDKYGNIKKSVKYKGDQKLTNLDISLLPVDIYYIRIFDGQKWESKSFRKQ